YSSIQLTIENDYLVAFNIEFSGVYEVEFDVVGSMSATYEDILSTEVTLPDSQEFVETEFIDPKLANELTTDQANDLSMAFNAQMDSYSLYYVYEASDGYEYGAELLDKEGSKNYYTGYLYSGGDTYNYTYYSEELANNEYVVYYDEGGVVVSEPCDEATYYDYYSPYSYTLEELGILDVSLFGYYEGTYVCNVNGLATINDLYQIDGGKVASIEVTVENGFVSTIKLVTRYAASVDYDAYSMTEYYTYSSINDVTVTIPEVSSSIVNELNQEQLDAFNNAITTSFDNVTINDSIFGYEAYFKDGEIEEIFYDSAEDAYYIMRFKVADGKYYYYDNSNKLVEIPYSDGDDCFIYLTPVVNFSAIDTSKLKYNSFVGEYVLDGADIDFTSFIYFYSDVLTSVDMIHITLDSDGHISSIYLDFTYGGDEYNNCGLDFYDYGTTLLYTEQEA
ncbi:MAG: hypothetical protein MR270_00125, partial [Erysipelotrichaceae bacterium]|nr:hypothetical protein [Erysipelotrichaceae bacterium]